tara:strand:+ start:169 stop:543 length:375 start_codon:yes stop_codon:yes gene_type:complete
MSCLLGVQGVLRPFGWGFDYSYPNGTVSNFSESKRRAHDQTDGNSKREDNKIENESEDDSTGILIEHDFSYQQYRSHPSTPSTLSPTPSKSRVWLYNIDEDPLETFNAGTSAENAIKIYFTISE